MTTDDPTWLLSALTFAVSMSGTPGPNNAMVASSGATFGYWRTMPHLLGVTIGFPLMLVAVAVGAGDLMRAAPMVHTVMKWAGAAYLVWLAIKIATARPTVADAGSHRSKPLTFLQAALFQWINPKAWMIALGAVATYTAANRVVVQSTILAAIFLLTTLPCLTFWTMTGVGAARLLRSERSLRAFNIAMAALLILSLLPLLNEA